MIKEQYHSFAKNSSSNELIEKLVASWSSPVVFRGDVGKFSGGLVSPKTMANADSNKTGPKTKICYGTRKVAYYREELAAWIAEKCDVHEHFNNRKNDE